ncbi:PhoH family protein [Longimicrobium terrae]|uniref:PhoH-like protein n=1 Tax=Longimicrobium terrae TaxID=1639882 RepID=A0A841H5S0_9BACT|nr:PhoH family protein [Longimicrobium terrae]MBB4639169.1 phosphate starvation-inducible PhoH-like protein [Longimicrobium terrae]MBB6073427.1 phosphate starvation-inducible PhoH-like protein [Longimicrobium terrae]NNC32585.1 PhoH family protein [Longimicrobium terrae]
MPDTANNSVQHRIPADRADPLALSGVNDANLLELGRLANLRVALRDDHLLLSGDLRDVERAVPVAQHMVEMARNGVPFGTDDVSRYLDASRSENGVRRLADAAGRVVVPGPKKTVSPKSEGQAKYLEAIENNDVVIGIGPAGTGKTYLAVAMAVDALFKKRVKRIILARPAVEAGENLGFLPGDLQEKIDPYLRPLYDALEDMIPPDRLRRAMESRSIEIAPLAYMRGRTLQDAFVILDEAQNATRAQMKMFLTRLGMNSKAVITGDKTQIDLPRREDSGLVEVESVLKGIEGIAFSYMRGADVIRHRLVKDIIQAYDAARGESSSEDPTPA